MDYSLSVSGSGNDASVIGESSVVDLFVPNQIPFSSTLHRCTFFRGGVGESRKVHGSIHDTIAETCTAIYDMYVYLKSAGSSFVLPIWLFICNSSVLLALPDVPL